jgi:hypothetical protein
MGYGSALQNQLRPEFDHAPRRNLEEFSGAGGVARYEGEQAGSASRSLSTQATVGHRAGRVVITQSSVYFKGVLSA